MVTQNLQALGVDSRVSGGLDQTFVALDLVPVVPSDTVDLAVHARAIRIQVGGTLRFTSFNGSVRNTTVTDGEVLLAYASRIHATGTTATGIEALI